MTRLTVQEYAAGLRPAAPADGHEAASAAGGVLGTLPKRSWSQDRD